MDSLPDGIVIKQYNEDMHPLLEDLETSTAIPLGKQFPLNQIKACNSLQQNYNAKSKQFKEFIILVAVEELTQKVIGVVNAVVKKVLFSGKSEVKVAQMFGLKVHKAYRRKGIASSLCLKLEEHLFKLDVSYLYVKADSTNYKAKGLYMSKLNYMEASTLRVKILNAEKSSEYVSKVSVDKGLRLTKEHYQDKDMTLVNIWDVFKSSYYAGTYVAESGDSIAGVSLWDSSGLEDMNLVKVILDLETLKKPFVHLLCLLGILLLTLASLALTVVGFYLINSWFFSVCFLVLAVWVLIKVLKFGFVFVKYSHYAIYKKQARRGKLFGLFYKGEESVRKQLVKQLIQGVKYEAQKLGLEYLIFEYGSKSPQAKYFPIHNFSMQVLQKALGKASVNEWSAESFIDPRE